MAPWAAAVEALGTVDVDAVATIGKHLDPAVLGDVPSNVRVERFVPQRFILDKASVVLSHAGAGSVLGAASRGIPQLHVPICRRPVGERGCGGRGGVAITCELDGRSAADIGAALERLLHDDRLQARRDARRRRDPGNACAQRPRRHHRSGRQRHPVNARCLSG